MPNWVKAVDCKSMTSETLEVRVLPRPHAISVERCLIKVAISCEPPQEV